MFPGMDPRAVKSAMKKMGIQQEELDAEEVIIKAKDREIIISNPSVTRIKMMGQTSFQVAGMVQERELKEEISDEDVKTVIEQTGASEADARKALEESKGDLAAAIVSIKGGAI